MSKTKRALVALFAVALIATACGDDDGGGGSGGYSSSVTDAYMEGCTSGGQPAAFCQCTLDELEDRFSEEEFVAFAIEASEEPPDEFVEIALACIGEADIGG